MDERDVVIVDGTGLLTRLEADDNATSDDRALEGSDIPSPLEIC